MNGTCAEYFSWDVEFGAFSIILNGAITVAVVIGGCVGNIYSIHMVKRFRISKLIQQQRRMHKFSDSNVPHLSSPRASLTTQRPVFQVLALYLVVLLLWDTGVLVCSMGFYALHAFVKIIDVRLKWLPYFTQIFNGPSSTCMTASIWMVVIITVSRYSAISNPLKHRAVETQRRAQIICAGATILSIIYCLPTYFEFTVGHCLHPVTQEQWRAVQPTSVRLSASYQFIYRVVLNLLLVSATPFLLILVLSLRMMFLLRQSLRSSNLFEGRTSDCLLRRKGTTRNRNQQLERKTSLMLIALLAKFLICYTLSTILNLVEAFQGEAVTSLAEFILVADISNFLVVCNSATNCVVYFWSGQKYRDLKHAPSQRQTTLHSVSTTEVTPNFTEPEIVLLSQGWKRAGATNSELSAKVLGELLRGRPEPNIPLKNHSEAMNIFLDQVIANLGAPQNLQIVFRANAANHSETAAALSRDVWVRFKTLMILEVLGMEAGQFRELTARSANGDERAKEAQLWNRLLSFVVSEMIRAMNEQSHRNSQANNV